MPPSPTTGLLASTFDDPLRRWISPANIPEGLGIPAEVHGMVQILGYSGNSTDRPHASTVGIRSVVGPIAGSGTLEAVPAQPVEPVRVRLASQELSGEFSHSLQALAPLQRPVMEAECGPDQGP